jgi:hypothetical protein
MVTNGLKIDNWDTPVYRVFSLRWFKDMITYRRNGLVRTSKWDDPFENFFLKSTVRTQSGEIGSLRPIHDGCTGNTGLCVDRKQSGDVLNIPFAYDQILDDVALDPRLDQVAFETLKADLLSLECCLPITQSDLYRIDEVLMPL